MLISLLLACPPVIEDDSGAPSDTAEDTAAETGGETGDTAEDSGWVGPDYSTAVLTTVSDDYASGVLATVNLDTWAITDNIVTTPTDNGVVAEDGKVYILGRYGYDYVRVYDQGSYAAPIAEFSVGDYANPADVALCGGKLYVSLYGSSSLNTYDPSTYLLNGAVDLSGYADADGIPEVYGMVERGNTLYVALQQLDSTTYPWMPAGGMVAAIDCATGTVNQTWNGLANVSLHEWPGHDAMLARTGVYFNADYSVALDGGVQVLDPATGLGNALLSESVLGENIADLVMVDDVHGFVLTVDAASTYTAWCWNVETSETVELYSTTSYLQGVDADDKGNAWVVARQSWADPASQGGIVTVDAVACTPGTETWHQDFTFAPYALAFF